MAGDGDRALLRRRPRRRPHLERRPQPAADQRGAGQPPRRHRSRPRRATSTPAGGRFQDHSATATAPTVVGSPRAGYVTAQIGGARRLRCPRRPHHRGVGEPDPDQRCRARVVQHQSDASNYTLGLHLGRSALHFNGTTDSAVIAARPALDITGPITLEAWINADKTDGLRDVFGHGYVSNPAGEVVLRIQDGNYYVGAYDGTRPRRRRADAGDRPQHVGPPRRRLRRRRPGGCTATACSSASAADPVGAVPVAGDWSIGAAAQTNDRFFAGAIDEVRLWRIARSAAQINADMNRRLDGAEPGLAGLWRAAGTTMRDVTANHHDATTRGAPTAVPGALSAYTVVATAGNHTVETSTQILSGEWTHLAASVPAGLRRPRRRQRRLPRRRRQHDPRHHPRSDDRDRCRTRRSRRTARADQPRRARRRLAR